MKGDDWGRWIITREDPPGGRPFDSIVVTTVDGDSRMAEDALITESTASVKPMKLWRLFAETDVETIVKVRGIEGAK